MAYRVSFLLSLLIGVASASVINDPADDFLGDEPRLGSAPNENCLNRLSSEVCAVTFTAPGCEGPPHVFNPNDKELALQPDPLELSVAVTEGCQLTLWSELLFAGEKTVYGSGYHEIDTRVTPFHSARCDC